MPVEKVSKPDLSQEAKDGLSASFIRVRFRGGRFEGDGGMPLSAIHELSSLDSLVNELGRYLWRKHKNRERLHADEYPTPPNLRVRSFAMGSSIPVIQRDEIVQDDALFVDSYDPYAESRDLVERTFWSIIESSEIPEDFPLQLVPNLKGIGKNLRVGETEEFLQRIGSDDWVSRSYTRQRRDDFWEIYDSRTNESRILLGHVRGLERGNESTFDFRDERTGQRLTGPCRNHWDALLEALGTSESHKLARLYVDAELDYRGRITKIVDLRDMEVLEMDGQHWRERFHELATMKNPEISGTSMVLSNALKRTDLLLSAAEERELDMPAVFPSHDGGTTLVWDLPVGRVTVYVEEDEDFEVESIPDGPLVPFSSESASETINKVKEYIDG